MWIVAGTIFFLFQFLSVLSLCRAAAIPSPKPARRHSAVVSETSYAGRLATTRPGHRTNSVAIPIQGTVRSSQRLLARIYTPSEN